MGTYCTACNEISRPEIQNSARKSQHVQWVLHLSVQPKRHLRIWEPPTFTSLWLWHKSWESMRRELDNTKAAGPDGIPPCFLRGCAEGLAKSLSFIFRKAKETGNFPSCWKISCIKPLHKQGAKNKVANYRAVALLSCVSKVFKKCIYDKLLEIVEPHISECQFGFRGGRSSVLQLLVSLNKIAESKDSSKATHAVYLDLKKPSTKWIIPF